MRTLGIETSCDETAVAVLDGDGTVRFSLISSQAAAHAPYLGVVPELAARRHLEALPRLLAEADRQAGLRSIELVAVTRGPGLIGSLLVGTCFAQAYAWGRGLPLVGVDHLEAHLVSPFLNLDGHPARPLPERTLSLVVSGGHSSYFLLDPGGAQPLNRTRDDAAGEVFDKVAAALGLGYPGGPVVDRLADGGDPRAFAFSAPRIKDPRGGLDFSFSGLKTMVIRAAQERAALPLADPASPPQVVLDLLASFRHTVVTWLLAPLDELAERHRPQCVAASGGVAANRELRRRLAAWGERSGVEVLLPPLALTTDNAAMIARAGQLRAARGRLDDPLALRAYPRAPWKRMAS
ncbi:MAG TPA: tRNA (adenosine(37)-N6)-threonylcarbamoyltransferase complex transferase subunit TsaD [Thermoanaerobaculaceae bacterium]|nr:tRNA (adenosine(37)-N6)-threonylcarbamoyltransferase complex transferase subunit TsaD [Thermoanaerobaculaceae bacterium]HRS14628.1 tRNA (adenosine(37)-N6)-threonylcarbamoyltransferase complex transferase subunit TsaD [Thermoanaerobaculaceae bacterium]